jgi:hypothetical protein
MPAMTGWEFLDLYRLCDEDGRKKTVTIMLTTSINPEDEQRSLSTPDVNGFRHKPLSRAVMEDLLKRVFPGSPAAYRQLSGAFQSQLSEIKFYIGATNIAYACIATISCPGRASWHDHLLYDHCKHCGQ